MITIIYAFFIRNWYLLFNRKMVITLYIEKDIFKFGDIVENNNGQKLKYLLNKRFLII